jgi:tRNA(Ile)-lysidine synthase
MTQKITAKNPSKTLTSKQVFETICSLSSCKKLWVAYSGGLDSHVLLDLVHKAFQSHSEYKISAIHIHHGLSPNADQWVEHCEKVCSNLQIPLTVLWVDATVTDGSSPEEVAREARLQSFEDKIMEDECILFAHHEEDQAETILLRLFRGAGPLGLAGMPEKGKIGKGEFIRPLLGIAKETILNYAECQPLQWVEDESNFDSRFDRNFLRHEILPHLKARWPRVLRSVGRSGDLCLETATAVQVLAMQDIQSVQNEGTTELSVSRLLQLDPIRRKGVIRYWLQSLHFPLPSRDHMERIDREVLLAKAGSHPQLKISNYEIRREKDKLLVAIYEKESAPL